MSTTNDYLNELVNQKKQLAQNLATKGIEASEDEKFNTLVPKVLEIQSGGGGGSVETCTVTFLNDILPSGVIYTDVNGEARSYIDEDGFGEVEIPGTFNTLKNSFIIITHWGEMELTNAELIQEYSSEGWFYYYIIQVKGDIVSIQLP